MKVNYVLLYGTPYLRYELFETFKKMSDFIVKKSIVNYSIFKKLEDKEEVEMIYRDNDIRVLEDIIQKAIEYCKDITSRAIDTTDTDYDLGQDSVARDILKIIRGEE